MGRGQPAEGRGAPAKSRVVVPPYVWALLALLVGIGAGGYFPGPLGPVAAAARGVVQVLVRIVPLLIFAALSPAIATLIRRGLAGRFVGAVVSWFVLTSAVAGLIGAVGSAALFRLPFSRGGAGVTEQLGSLLAGLGSGGGAALPLVAILLAVAVSLVATKSDPLYGVLQVIERGTARVGAFIGYLMVPLILGFGVMIGVTFGARLGMSHYGTVILFAAGMSLFWWSGYVLGPLRLLGGVQAPGRLLKEYFVPTALFASGTCSSLATMPVNVVNARRYGVRDEVADFVIPCGAVGNMDGSAMQLLAYAPLIAGHVFGLQLDWLIMLVAWPLILVYTIAASGVPGAMGAGLWSGVLFASLLGLEDPLRATFVGTWVALVGGVPDMFRTAVNTTTDGFTAVIFDRNLERYRGRGSSASAGRGRDAPPPLDRRASARSRSPERTAHRLV